MSRNGIIAIVVLICLVGGSAGYVLLGKGTGSDDDDATYEEGYPRTVEDFYGNKVTFYESPKRIVTMGMEFLAYLGPEITERVIWTSGSKSSTDADPLLDLFDLDDVATVSGSMISNVENIIAKKPDLVLMGDARTSENDRIEFKNTLNAVGINVFFFTNQSNLFSNSKECIELNLIPMSKIFNMEERANTLLNFVNTKTDELAERLSGVDNSVLKNVYVGGGAGKQMPNFLGSSANTYFPIMYLDGYVNNIMKDIAPDVEHTKFDDFERLYQYESEVANIDYIFVSQSCWTDFRTMWNSDSTRFEALEAFKTGDVYFVMNWFPRSTNPLISAYSIAAQMFPEQFSDFDIRDLIEETFELFYGFEGAGAEAYNVLVGKTKYTTGQDIEIFGKIDLTKL
ncbi:MAG: ABC transporter substrate-binding protein [Candidatus Methanomethylophilaceae archaeon]|jgi:ABC-type Fe3+-hydroxamate transport system substrate-binding protein